MGNAESSNRQQGHINRNDPRYQRYIQRQRQMRRQQPQPRQHQQQYVPQQHLRQPQQQYVPPQPQYTPQQQQYQPQQQQYQPQPPQPQPQQQQQQQQQYQPQPPQQQYNQVNTNSNNESKHYEITPYDVFNITESEFNSGNITEKYLKKQYKKLALIYHPDKNNGNSRQFELLKDAYVELVSKLREKNKYTDTKTTHHINVDYQENQRNTQVDSIIKNYEPVHIDKNNLDMNKFNKVFDQFHINSPYSQGYGNMMDKRMADTNKSGFNIQYQPNQDTSSAMNDRQFFKNDFSQQNFNESFQNKINNVDSQNSKVIEYKEPESMQINNKLDFQELGVENVDDFTSGMNANVKCTDYKQAYYHQNTITDKVSDVDISKKSSSMNQIKSERSNINYNMSMTDKQHYDRMKKDADLKEMERQQRIKYRDNIIGDKYQQMNRLVIQDKR